MLYPKSFEDKLEFGKIREIIGKNCSGSLGATRAGSLAFSSDFDTITLSLKQTIEFKKILTAGEPFPSLDYFDYGTFLVKASKIDAYLSEEEFHNLKLSLSTIGGILNYLSKKTETYTELSLLTVGIYLNPVLLKEIERVIDEHGRIRDNASSELADIRSTLRKQQFRVRRVMEKMLGEFIQEGYSNDDATVTLRNGRLVLPVRSEFKRSTGGFIHDESASGLTAFIEPANALEINNDIMDLEYQEKRELVRILSRLTDLVRPEIANLGKCLEFIGLMDFIRAKARLAIDLDASMPEIVKKPAVKWINARHPLLFLSHKAIKKTVVPLDLSLSAENRILIISGPNAGGKSVCLKTTGIIQYMMQCGLLVPMSEGSTMGIFNSILVDIGDEQSIENDLSTYSSHLINMKAFLAYAAPKTMFLIDEFGAGTEPQFGGAIAESILDNLLQSKAYGIITTHYSNLKKFAGEHPGIVNGAMRFDLDNMEPQFVLDIGRPGSSFAIEIAAKIGLPEQILSKATDKVGVEQVKYEKLIVELENEKRKLDEGLNRLASREKELKKIALEYEELKKYLDNRKQEIIHEAKSQARDILNETNKTVEKTIREIRESQAEKKAVKIAREEIEKVKNKVRTETPRKPLKITSASPKDITVGSRVRIKDQETVGQVLSVRGKETEIAVGEVKIKVPLNRLEIVSGAAGKTSKPATRVNLPGGLNVNEKMQQFTHTLDIRGKRGDEAINELDQYLDQALMLNMKEVRILHGKGNGILRKLVREQVMRYNFIQEASDEDVERGGSGITVVRFK